MHARHAVRPGSTNGPISAPAPVSATGTCGMSAPMSPATAPGATSRCTTKTTAAASGSALPTGSKRCAVSTSKPAAASPVPTASRWCSGTSDAQCSTTRRVVGASVVRARRMRASNRVAAAASGAPRACAKGTNAPSGTPRSSSLRTRCSHGCGSSRIATGSEPNWSAVSVRHTGGNAGSSRSMRPILPHARRPSSGIHRHNGRSREKRDLGRRRRFGRPRQTGR